MSSKLRPLPSIGHPVLGYPSRLLSRTVVAKETVAFEFERPRNFLFRPGQFIELTLRGVPRIDSDGLYHTFSIASSCFASEIVVATRMRDSVFKRALSALPLGTEVSIRGPMGSFVLHANPLRPAVFLAGGIGIAPFVSMLSSAASDRTRPPIFLFYANRQIEDAAFMEALWELEVFIPSFHFFPTFTRGATGHGRWKGKTGPITAQMLSEHISDLQNPIYYIAGPPSMVEAVHQVLVELAVDEEDIRTEHFADY